MSLKITNENGFVIGGVLNPSITEIYVRVLPNQMIQSLLQDNKMEIPCKAATTVSGGFFDREINVDFISNQYQLKYSATVLDYNACMLEIETDLMEKLVLANPEWEGNITIVTVPIVQQP